MVQDPNTWKVEIIGSMSFGWGENYDIEKSRIRFVTLYISIKIICAMIDMTVMHCANTIIADPNKTLVY